MLFLEAKAGLPASDFELYFPCLESAPSSVITAFQAFMQRIETGFLCNMEVKLCHDDCFLAPEQVSFAWLSLGDKESLTSGLPPISKLGITNSDGPFPKFWKN